MLMIYDFCSPASKKFLTGLFSLSYLRFDFLLGVEFCCLLLLCSGASTVRSIIIGWLRSNFL